MVSVGIEASEGTEAFEETVVAMEIAASVASVAVQETGASEMGMSEVGLVAMSVPVRLVESNIEVTEAV